MRRFAILAALAAFAVAAPAAAETAIGFTDTSDVPPNAGNPLSSTAALAMAWTQTVALNDATISAYVGLAAPDGEATAGSWWIVRQLGGDAGDVVASGTFTPLLPPAGDFRFPNLGGLTPVTLGSGLDLDRGSYYLVLNGGEGGARWLGESTPFKWTADLAPGFTLRDRFGASPDSAFAPGAAFSDQGSVSQLGFRLEGTIAVVPEPAAWALMLLGFAAAGAALRRRPATA
jgi:hypothetical protein